MHWALVNSETVLPERGFGKLSSSLSPSLMFLHSCSYSQVKWDRLQHFPTLENFQLLSVSGLRTLPEAMRCFTSLIGLHLCSLKDLEALPGWLGQFTCLVGIVVEDCPKLTSLPDSMRGLFSLEVLRIVKCPILVARCQGEDVHKISHIPTVKFE